MIGLTPALLFALLLVSCGAAAATAAAATVATTPESPRAEGPLLSGYGGPGAGEQAILGSHLLSGHGHGPGGGAGSAVSSTSSASGGAGGAGGAGVSALSSNAGEEGAGGAASAHGSGSSSRAGAGLPKSAGRPHGGYTTSTGGSSGASHRGVAGQRLAVGGESAVAAQPLGLSGGDIVAVVLVACALTGAAFMTRVLARGER